MSTKEIWEVRLRDGFSDRNQIEVENKEMQFKEIDERSRVALVNELAFLWGAFFETYPMLSTKKHIVMDSIVKNVYVQEISINQDVSESKLFSQMSLTIRKAPYNQVLDLIEFVCHTLKLFVSTYLNDNTELFHDRFNDVFETEYIGYRFVGGQIVSITNKEEIIEIESALTMGLRSVEEHLRKSLSFLSDRNNPDYENSIKESISSVEAMVRLLSNQEDKDSKKFKLCDALRDMKNKTNMNIHPALVEAFVKLFGYASDASGIRHAAKIGEPDATFSEARFVLVTCSAFVNYLKAFIPESM